MKNVNYKLVGLVVSVSLFVVFLYLMDAMEPLHLYVYDNVYEREEEVNDDIVIVGIDDESYREVGRWPFSRVDQAQIFKNILKDKPKVLGIDILYDAQMSNEEDEVLLEVLERENVVVAVAFAQSSDSTGHTHLIEPFDALNKVTQTGFINSEPSDTDGVVRTTAIVKEYEQKFIDGFSYKIYKYLTEHGLVDKKYDETVTVDQGYYINYVGKPNTYNVVSAGDVYKGIIPESYFEDKIVLFGPYSLGMQDHYFTPLDKETAMFGVEIHATVLQNLMENSFKKEVPKSLSFFTQILLIILLGIVVFFIGFKLSYRFSHLINGLLAVMVLIAGYAMYSMGYVFNIVYLIVVIIVMDIVALGFNYINQLIEKRHITQMFGKYVAPQVVEQILEVGEEQIQLGGKKKEVSILFVDIRGFTPLSEVAPPEEVVEILNEYLELCSNAIFDHEGTLDKFIGDATMALFNAPLDLDDHEFRAVSTAWQMKENGERLAEDLYEKYGRRVQFGIGVNVGPAIIGNIGSTKRMDYTAIGDAVNTSARLESKAKPGQILISEEVYKRIKDRIKVTPLGLISVKGKKNEINVFQVDGIL